MKLQHTTDIELIHAFQEGDEQALEVLIHRYKEKIFSSIFYLAKDRPLAEDLFQDVFIKIIDTLRSNRYNEEGKFLQWAMRIAHNLCIDYFRKVKHAKIVNSGEKDIFEVVMVNTESADTRITKFQSYEKVKTMLDKLPSEQREVIVLRHFADMSFKEIAQTTNTSINTALGRMRYGLINLRKMMLENQIVL